VVSAFGETQVVLPGFKTGVQLGAGPDGLQASGPPNAPAPYDFTNIQHAPVNLLDRQVPILPAGGDGGTGIVPTATSTAVSTLPATQTTACTPRADWQFRYVIQRGDNLSIIAQRLNMRTADLHAGNGIDNPNLLVAAQTLRVPREVPPPPPTVAPTLAASPTPAGMIGPNLRADKTTTYNYECTTVRWDVDNIQAVYFEGQPVVGHDARDVCPTGTTTYTLMVVQTDGSQKTFPITINVVNTCGNGVCEPDYGEDSSTCDSDCYIIS
jgi:LysM repeat protein